MSFVGNLITQLDKSDPIYKNAEWAIKHTAGAFYSGMLLMVRSQM